MKIYGIDGAEMKLVIKMLLIFMLSFFQQLQAKVLDATYNVSYGLFGVLGVSHAHLEITGDKYTIKVSAKTIGIAKHLSRNRQEHYVSHGHIVNGMLVSDRLHIIRTYGKKYNEKSYRIDHKKREVIKHIIRKKNGKIYRDEEKTLDFYSKDDILTLYFNLSKMIDKNALGKTYHFSAVGAEKQGGKITLILPERSQLPEYKKSLGEGEYWYLTAILYQKIFNSNRGELMLAIGEEGIAQKAVLKDLLLFGDLVAKRIK